ncbi:hypothetical protein PUR71_07605 [Streptomyces sp. SP17BM10]|uniref:hypothetical protein n=1 Tax=Streptomyces sp. SP17BM10 TaxID=3002530 RepID=UPI002E77F179|nr:hypothetical protein [Streptomyces sp. SP17BM10]MEE1782780.1 hypothetical protein [Streptomyces sp. SP17BM10]
MNTGNDSEGAAADLAAALDAFTHAAAPGPGPHAGTGAGADVWLTIHTPYDIEQHTLRLPVDVADWITELLHDETRNLEAGRPGEAGGQEDGQNEDVEPAWW